MTTRRLLHLTVAAVLIAALFTSAALAQREAGIPQGSTSQPQPIGPWQIVEVMPPAEAEQANASERGAWPVERVPYKPDDQALETESEPNDTTGTATPLGSSNTVLLGNIYPSSDVDYYSFTATAGDRVYAAVMTSFSPASTDSVLDLISPDGTTIVESDDNDGTFDSTSSSIAGAVITATGTYYLRVRQFSTSQIRPYHLHVRVQSGSPAVEVEPNDLVPQPLPLSGWIAGTITATTDIDFFSLNLNAGDSVYVSLDLDPERDGVEWNGSTGLGVFNGFILVGNDAGTATPDSEAFFMTVKNAGTYRVIVYDGASATAVGTYQLSVSVHPAAAQTCTTYTSTNVPLTLPADPGVVTSTLTIPGHPRIADLNASITLTHTNTPDLDAVLVSPAGNENALFTDIGASSQISMNLGLDDEAGIPAGQYIVVSGLVNQPERVFRLDWFDGEDAGGVWSLRLGDDLAANGGRLLGWSLTVCEVPPPPSCPASTVPVTLYAANFEANDGSFTHSGTLDEWERGLPTFAPVTGCNSGVNCWKTDLDNTYEASSNQELLSPNINLTGTVGPVRVTWAQKYQIESATFDHAFVDVREVGGANPRRLWQWLGPTQTTTVFSPTTTLNESAGWGTYSADISSYAGQNIELLFHLDSDTVGQYGGYAIDDVTVTACVPAQPSIAVSKTVGTNAAACAVTDTIVLPPGGGDVTYCYEVENTGNIALARHTLADSELGVLLNNFPYSLAPGSSAFLTQSAAITRTTINTATWTAFNPGPVDTAVASDTATVDVQPYLVYLPLILR